MKFFYNYVIKIEREFNQTFKTEGGLELYGHESFSKDRLSNRYAEIISAPIKFDGKVLEVGTKVLIDPGVYYHALYENNRVELTTNTIDREKGLYSIEPQNIVMYFDNESDSWKGYMNNFLAEFEMVKKEEKSSFGIIIEVGKKERKKGVCKVVYANDFLKENDIEVGDEILVKPNYGIPVWIDGKEYSWLRDSEVLCKMLSDAE